MVALVRDGLEISGLYADRPLNAEPGHFYYATDLRVMLVYDDSFFEYIPADSGTLLDMRSVGFIWDDFRGESLASAWAVNSGADDLAADPVIASGDYLSCVSGDSGTPGSDLSAFGLTTTPFIEAEEGKVTMIGRLKIDTVANGYFFFGLSDDDPDGTLEQPVSLATATYTTNASDACGFMFDAAATTDTIRLVGVAGDTDATHVDTGIAPEDDTWITFKLELSATGVLTGWINGALVGTTVAAAVTVGTDLVPVGVFNTRTTASRTGTVDGVLVKHS